MQVTKREAEAIFNKLEIDLRGTHHKSGWFKYNDQKVLHVYFSHGRGAMPGKVGDKFRQSFRINEQQFRDLRDCPLDKDGYVEILKEKNIIASI